MDEARFSRLEDRLDRMDQRMGEFSNIFALLHRLDERSVNTNDSVRSIHLRLDEIETRREEEQKAVNVRFIQIELDKAEEKPIKSAAKFIGAGIVGSVITGCTAWLAGKWP